MIVPNLNLNLNRNSILLSLSQNLTHLRHLSSLSQEEVASLLSTSHNNISRYETGNSNPTLLTLVKFARIYQCKVEDIVRGI